VIIVKRNVALLGGTGTIGQRFVKILEDHPFFDLTLIVGSRKKAGKEYGRAVHWLLGSEVPGYVKNLKIEEFKASLSEEKDIDLIFSALLADVAEKYEGILRTQGFAVFSNSGAYRMNNDVPILVPEVNPEHIKLADFQRERYGGYITTNPNCSTYGLAMILKPLEKYGIKRVFVSTYQAISGAGYPGVSGVDINGNLIPCIGNEEDKIRRETKKILGEYRKGKIRAWEIDILASCVRVPVRDGHLESVIMEMEENTEIREIKETLRSFKPLADLPSAPSRPIIIREEDDRPQPILDAYTREKDRAGGMSVVAGRLNISDRYLRLFLLVHNTIRGGAGNAILNAEYALKKDYV